MISVEFATFSDEEWAVDFQNGCTSDPEASLQTVRQAVRCALETQRFDYPTMGNNFGMDWRGLLGRDTEYVKSEIAYRIRDALSIDDRITSVERFEFKTDGENLTVSMVVRSTAGDIPYAMDVRLQ